MTELVHGAALLPTLVAITRIARSLYGPGKARKQVTDAHGVTRFTSDALEIVLALQSEHAALAMLRESLQEHMRACGTVRQRHCERYTTLLNVTNALGDAAADLQRHGMAVGVVRDALARTERTCLQTLKRMRLPIPEAISGFDSADYVTQLRLLGERLQTRTLADGSTSGSRLTVPMQLALELVAHIDPLTLEDSLFHVDSAVSTCIALGGSAGERASGSRVFSGVLVPVASDHRAQLQRAFVPSPSVSNRRWTKDEVLVARRAVAIHGAYDVTRLEAHAFALDVDIVFVCGDVSAQTMDKSWQMASKLRCVPVDSCKEHERIAALSGALIVESWSELLPCVIGTAPLTLRLIEIAATRRGDFDDDDDDDDEDDDPVRARGTHTYSALYVNVDRLESPRPLQTLLVRGATRSEAEELQQRVRSSLQRIVLALRSGYVLPSSGAVLCACAAELRLELAERLHSTGDSDDSAAVAIAVERFATALSELAALLLQNTGTPASELCSTTSDALYSCLAHVQRIQRNYMQGIRDVGRTTFYASCLFSSSDYCALPTEPSERARLDDYTSVRAAVARSFRLLDVVLCVASYRINAGSASAQEE